ncbi:MAG TPA: tetratricopeptide repeat protein, partial [Catalimonadaceae bacterium]|nr:tetratricopeptide repeat protein [Catalimonadaceae bacterium]
MKGFTWFIFSVLIGAFVVIPQASGQGAGWDYHKSDSLFKSGAYAEALQENLKALRFVEKSGSCSEIVHAHIQIGRIHYFLTNRLEAIRWFRKSLPMASACGVDSLVGKSYKNLGALFFEEQQPDSAIHYLEKARLFLSPSHNAKDLSQLFSSLFEVFSRSKKNIVLGKQYLDS